MNVKAILFDLDGTLLDTIGDLALSMNNVLKMHGWPQHDTKAYKYFVGSGIRNLVTRALPEAKRDNETVEACLAEMNAQYKQNWNKTTHPYEEIPELLEKLSGKGLKAAVLSNKANAFTKEMVEYFFPRYPFISVIGERSNVPIKPNPQAALEIAGTAGIIPSQFIYLGDSGIDMETARAAGMFPVGALWGFRSREELESSGAKALISRPLQLLDLI